MQIRLFLMLWVSVILPACASSLIQLSSEQRQLIQQEKKTLVVFRLTAHLEHEMIAPLTQEGNVIPIGFGLANLDAGEPVREVTTASSDVLFGLSPDAARGGWAGLAVDPGTYYFVIHTPVGQKWYQPSGPSIPEIRFRFTVRPGNALIYIGSVRLDCISTFTSTLLGPRKAPPFCSPNAVAIDESQEAATMLQNAGLPAPLTDLMKSYFTPLPPGQLAALSPVGVLMATGEESNVQSPEWMSRAMHRGLRYGLAPSLLLAALAGGAGGAPGPGAGAVLALGILWAPVGATLGAISGYIGGKWSESRFEPCRKTLRESLNELEPDSVLRQKLGTTLHNWGIQTIAVNLGEEDTTSDPNEVRLRSIVHTQIQRITLRHCEADSQNLCVEVAVRTRVIETNTNSDLYDTVLFYTNGSNPAAQPYELPAHSSEWTLGQELDAFCGENGVEIFHGEIARALDAIVNQLARDFSLRAE